MRFVGCFCFVRVSLVFIGLLVFELGLFAVNVCFFFVFLRLFAYATADCNSLDLILRFLINSVCFEDWKSRRGKILFILGL